MHNATACAAKVSLVGFNTTKYLLTYLECCKGVSLIIQHQPNRAEMAPTQLLQYQVAALFELLTNINWVVATCGCRCITTDGADISE